ncbi:MAG TPA: SCO family protein [Micropepsaceae bacterium]|nr:SCO family protein [Micropepsaceae bacterium]
MSNRLRWIIVVVALALGGVAATLLWMLAEPRATTILSTQASTIGGPFTLTDNKGVRVTDADYRGRPMLIFFGFTSCPDVCPLTLQKLADALALAGPMPLEPRVLMISVDPARDTPEMLDSYVRSFRDDFIGLTGTQAEIDSVVGAYRAYAKRIDMPDSAMVYTMDHSSFIYVMGADGAFITVISPDGDAEAMAKALKAALLP